MISFSLVKWPIQKEFWSDSFVFKGSCVNQLKHHSTSKISDFAKNTFLFFSYYTILCFSFSKGQKTNFHALQHVCFHRNVTLWIKLEQFYCTPSIPVRNYSLGAPFERVTTQTCYWSSFCCFISPPYREWPLLEIEGVLAK